MLAPLAGISDSPFRLICRRAGAGMVFSEMVSAEGLLRNISKSWEITRFQEEERPIGVQLFSHDPTALAEAAARLDSVADRPDALDLNFGCPVRKVVRRGAGAGFMESPGRIGEAVRAVGRSVSIPVWVKLRSGASADRLTAVEAARAAEGEGAAAVTVHARTASQIFKGKADWKIIAAVKAAIKIPVIGNGDVSSPDDMLRMFVETNCDGVMIGRGSLGNPWIFSVCRAKLTGEEWKPPTPSQVWDLIENHYLSVIAFAGPKRGTKEMRKHLGWYSRSLKGAAQFRAGVMRLDDPQEVLAISSDFFLNDKNYSQLPEDLLPSPSRKLRGITQEK